MSNIHPEQLVQQLMRLRELTTSHLPIGHSFIPYDILLTVVNASISNTPLTVKSLFTALPYSDMGLRYHLRKLISTQWVELKPSSKDMRSKELIATPKLLEALDLINASLK